MKIHVENETYTTFDVKFSVYTAYHPIPFGRELVELPVLCTACKVAIQTCDFTTTLTGRAFCSPRDNFDYTFGRKLAFSRAVEMLGDRDTRKTLWREFFKRPVGILTEHEAG